MRNRERCNALRRELYRANPHKIRAQRRNFSKELHSTEEGRARCAAYYQNNRDHINEQRRTNYAASPDKFRARSKESSAKLLSTEEGRARYKVYYQRYRDRIFQELMDFFGGKCVRCGFDDGRALQMDHIHGRGQADRKKPGGFCLSRRHTVVMKNPDWARATFQLLCANCNCIKRVENKEYGKGGGRKRAA